MTFLEKGEWRISIHALRVEGDKGFLDFGETVEISIHALRVEGDQYPMLLAC